MNRKIVVSLIGILLFFFLISIVVYLFCSFPNSLYFKSTFNFSSKKAKNLQDYNSIQEELESLNDRIEVLEYKIKKFEDKIDELEKRVSNLE